MKKYEYKFVKIKSTFFGREPKGNYQSIIEEHGALGWRLNQIFHPIDSGGSSRYELIFEREMTA